MVCGRSFHGSHVPLRRTNSLLSWMEPPMEFHTRCAYIRHDTPALQSTSSNIHIIVIHDDHIPNYISRSRWQGLYLRTALYGF